ncbi:MAG: TetR/AcrR family transcriptional regulator [Anaerolineae bacterium]|nr:TetR/AcrR family transcriptional regulator [Anaerolineae bacterium]
MTAAKPILTPEARRQRNRDEMVMTILDTARDIMREQGVAALSVQEIARRIGMRAPSLYNYFPNKNAIYEALFVTGMRLYRERFEQLRTQHGATWEGLQRMMEDYLSFALENPELYQLLFERPVPGFVPSSEGIEEANRLLEAGNHLAAEAISSGAFQPPVSGDVMMNLFIGIMHGVTAQHLANEPQLPLGSGRFGSLFPLIIDILRNAWGQDRAPKK